MDIQIIQETESFTNANPWKSKRIKKHEVRCHCCGNIFLADRKTREYCSRSCASKKKMGSVKICKMCGIEFIERTRGTHDANIFCSRKCSYEYIKVNANPKPKTCPVYFRYCMICGNIFTSKRPHRNICSLDKCNKKNTSNRSYENSKSKKIEVERTCKECGKVFIPEYGNKRRLFCSQTCLEKHAKRIWKTTRRARKKNVTYETFDPLKILERDKWKCKLCGIKTPKSKRGTVHSNAPEVDHIIPLALGGSHAPGNVQCLCRACNQKKSATVQGQLRLY